MRIIIIATARTGGRQLGEWISKELKHQLYHEPNTTNIDGDNIVVKHIVNSVVDLNMELQNGFDPNAWDKIITLKRKDIRKAAESMVIAEYNQKWHSPYTIPDEWIKEHESEIKENEPFIGKGNEVIDKIEFAGLKLTYEGIYETGKEIPMLKEYLGITNPQYQSMLDKKNKYRRDILI